MEINFHIVPDFLAVLCVFFSFLIDCNSHISVQFL